MKKIILFLIVLFLTIDLGAFSLQRKLTEKSKISLLTCSPNDEAIYSLFGHSGLRVQDDSLGIDYVFDYGIFDFDSDNFIYRFVKGETDYMVGARPFSHFIGGYSYRSVGVTEQIINLSQNERQSVFDALVKNSLPENRIYRYNFFYDNCATRPRDILADNIDGNVVFASFTEEQSYRDLLDECLGMNPWSRFGINLVIGSDADKVITERQKDFLPEYVSKALGKAKIETKEGNVRDLVIETEQILQPEGAPLRLIEAKKNNERATNYPLLIGCALLSVAILVSYLSYTHKKRGIAKAFDTALFLSAGLAGCIIFFLTFFSEHPCVDKNWNIVWLNPIALLIVPFFFVKSLTKYVISYHFINFVALSLFIAGYIFIPQKLEIAFIPYILTLWVRSGEYILEHRFGKKD